jgi:hypothetical protein
MTETCSSLVTISYSTINGVVFDDGFFNQLLDFFVLGCYILQLLISVFQTSNEFGTRCALSAIRTCMFNCRAAGLVDLDCEQELHERHCSSHDW